MKISKSAQFQNKAAIYISRLNQMINKMPHKGDSEDTSQKICLLNSLFKFEENVNGVVDLDFYVKKED